MAREPSEAARLAMGRRRPPPQDKLDKLLELARQVRDVDGEISELGERLAELTKRRQSLLAVEIPEMMRDLRMPSFSVGADGNRPEIEIELRPFYQANIAAAWDDDRRERAFSWLKENGYEDVIKNTVTANIGMRQAGLADKVSAALDKLKVKHTIKKSVPHGTLTALVKERTLNGDPTPLETLGATVGEVAVIKQKEQ